MKKRTLFILITMALGVLIIAGGIGASEIIRQQLTNNLISDYGQQEQKQNEQIAQTLALEVAQTQARLNLIAKLPAVQSGDTASCNAQLQLIANDPQTKVGNLGRVGPDGAFRCSLNPKLIGVKASTLGSYITEIFTDPNHAAVMSRVIKPAGATSYLIAIHVPVWGEDGSFQGTLGGAIYLSNLSRDYLLKTPLAAGGYVSLYDDDGTVLYNYKPELIGQNIASPDFRKLSPSVTDPSKTIADIKSGVEKISRYSFDNSEKVAAFGPVHIFPGRTWRIVTTVPIASVRSSVSVTGVDHILIELPILLSLLTLILLGLFIWATSREVFRPLEAIDKAKTEFVSLASHQLRTPLTAINWYTEMLMAGDAGVLTDPQLKYVKEIYTGNQRMVELVNALLNVSRLDLGTFIVEPVALDLETLIRSVIAEQQSEITRKAITLSLKVPSTRIESDSKLLRMVFQNLLSNAVKYTPAQGVITLTLAPGVDARTLLFTITDTGWGIPLAQQDKIFTKLFRADNVREKDAEGTGLGLYLVKAIVEKLGGTIRFESEENKGTTFLVTLQKKVRCTTKNRVGIRA